MLVFNCNSVLVLKLPPCPTQISPLPKHHSRYASVGPTRFIDPSTMLEPRPWVGEQNYMILGACQVGLTLFTYHLLFVRNPSYETQGYTDGVLAVARVFVNCVGDGETPSVPPTQRLIFDRECAIGGVTTIAGLRHRRSSSESGGGL